ncbi:DUF922 domain-containing protein [Urechidicola vernalis]|uniref:DUF922 domain-containing protein n=1 Tax=Urechidicola vernalis TaxID=3075600 RepID=A0ABU2Y667_9FLAO|nr:hypothetical protein [Urechidicola sp. P050]MDT0553699.1 hypothetical protein [Urechidicola sp. P050]
MNNRRTIFFLLIACIIFQSITAQDNIQWSKSRKLEWKDFQGQPNEDVYAAALTSYKIEITPSKVIVDENNNIKNFNELTVKAYFYKNHSWVVEMNDYLLQHEQLHFDIAELFARKMRVEFKKLQAEKIANFDTYYGVYKKLWAACREMQQAFDKESNHSINEVQNNLWVEKINSLLQS